MALTFLSGSLVFGVVGIWVWFGVDYWTSTSDVEASNAFLARLLSAFANIVLDSAAAVMACVVFAIAINAANWLTALASVLWLVVVLAALLMAASNFYSLTSRR